MRHCDPEILGLVALGESASPEDHRHLETCEACRADVARLREVVTAMRSDDLTDPGYSPMNLQDVVPQTPPASVWAGIAAATGVRAVPRFDRMAPTATNPPQTAHQPAESPHLTDSSQDSTEPPDHPPAEPPSVAVMQPRRPGTDRRIRGGSVPGRFLLLGVAASTLLLGAAGGSLVTWQLTRPDPVPQAMVRYSTDLGALPAAPSAHGTASVIETDGGPRLRVDVADIRPLEGAYYEVWLIDRSVTRMVPVGILQGTTGEFVIPAGLDLSDYSVVDISVESPGDPTHSGRSVLRGIIQV